MDYQNQTTEYVEMPPNHKTWAIVNIVLAAIICGGATCTFAICGVIINIIALVFAILALLKSNEVSKFAGQGEAYLMQAQEASSKAKLFNIVSTALIVLNLLLFIAFFAFYFFGILGSELIMLPFLD